MVVPVWKCRSRRQSTRSSRCRRKAAMSWRSSCGSSSVGDQQVLGQGELPLAEDGVGLGQQFLRLAARWHRGRSARCRPPAAADGPRRHRRRGRHAPRGQVGDQRPGQLVDEGAEGGVLLRRPADGGEGPDGAGAVVDLLDVHAPGNRGPGCSSRDGRRTGPRAGCAAGSIMPTRQKSASAGTSRPLAGGHDRQAVAAEQAGKGQFRHPFGQRHDRRQGQARRPADEDIDPQRLARPDGLGMMDADAAVDLVVQADLAVRVHSGCRRAAPGTCRGWSGASPGGRDLAVDLRQGDEGAAVLRPGHELRQLRRVVVCLHRRPPGDPLRAQVVQSGGAARGPCRDGSAGPPGRPWRHQGLDGRQGVAEEEAGALQGAEQVAQQRESAALDAGEEQGRAAVR